MRDQPDPRAGEQRDERGQREPAENWKAGDGHQQEPIERREPERDSADISEAKTLAAGVAVRGGEHERGRDPRKTGEAEFRKRQRQQQPRSDCGQPAAVAEEWFEDFFQRTFYLFQVNLTLAHSKTLRAVQQSPRRASASWTAVALHRFSRRHGKPRQHSLDLTWL